MNERLDRLGPYVRHLANRMGLDQCTIHVIADDSEEQSYATVECTPGRHVAVIRIGQPFWTADESSQRDSIVHELIHVILRRVQDAPTALKSMIGSVGFGAWSDRFDEEVEYAVDHLAKLIAPTLPTQGRLEFASN